MALLRPEYGPSAPELLQRRFGWPLRRSVAAAVALVVLVAVAVRVVVDDGKTKAVVHGTPTFSLRFDPELLHRAAPRAGELLRIEGRARGSTASVVARHLRLPPFDGNVVTGLLPVLAAQRLGAVGERFADLRVLADGKARGFDADGYQLAYRTGPKGSRTFVIEADLLPTDGDRDKAVSIVVRQDVKGRRRGRARRMLVAAKDAFRSFQFGSGRPFLFGG